MRFRNIYKNNIKFAHLNKLFSKIIPAYLHRLRKVLDIFILIHLLILQMLMILLEHGEFYVFPQKSTL